MLSLEQKRTDRFLIERFSHWLPGWNSRQLTLDDLGHACDDCGIVVVEMALHAEGLALWIESQPFIYINSLLPYPERVITGYHELAHILYHTPRPEIFRRQKECIWNFSKQDRQAEIIGSIAWMPETEAHGLSADTLMLQFEVGRETATFRASLDLWKGEANL
jgi:Zn-dependent peptidase ImmA (M78 family)